MDPIERLPQQLNRRNWVILGVLLLVSLAFGDLALTQGILAGGLLAIGGFFWMRRSLQKLLDQPGGGARARFQFGYVVRLVALAICLAILIAVVKIHPLGLVVGLSVVVINLLTMTIQRAFK